MNMGFDFSRLAVLWQAGVLGEIIRTAWSSGYGVGYTTNTRILVPPMFEEVSIYE
jgi:hypothetical protein